MTLYNLLYFDTKTGLSNIKTLFSVDESTVMTSEIDILISSNAHTTNDLRDNLNLKVQR